jgi:hypothetical protein
MTPAFPHFEPLQRSHEPLIRRITRGLPPYCDFLFSNLYAWNTAGETAISVLHGNLVVHMKDYESDDRFLTLIGTRRIVRTVECLLSFAAGAGLPTELRLVPDITVRSAPELARWFTVRADPSAYDYVYRTADMAILQGADYEDLRTRIHRFARTSAIEPRQLDMQDPHTQRLVLDLFDRWADQKGVTREEPARNERTALERYFAVASDPRHLALVLCDGAGEPCAFAMIEILGNGLADGHFAKGDRSIPGSADALRQCIGAFLHNSGIRYLNAEQDLGLPHLRAAKQAWKPCCYLRKFTIGQRNPPG